MEYPIVSVSRSLVVIDQMPDLIDYSLDAQIREELNEAMEIQSQVDGVERTIGHALHSLNFIYPEISQKLFVKLNKFRELNGMSPLSRDVDPVSQKKESGKTEEEEQAEIEEEAEEAARKAIMELEDKDLTPGQRAAKHMQQRRKEKCKRFYLKIAKMTHPDKVKDPDLNNLFHQAKKAYEALDLDSLESMHQDIKAYTSLKGNRGKFRDFKYRRLLDSRHRKNVARNNLEQLKAGLPFECSKAYSQGGPVAAKPIYEDFIEEQCYRVQKAIEDIQATMRLKRTAEYSFRNTTTSTSSW